MRYGVAVSSNGLSRIYIGIAKKVTPKGNVTLSVEESYIGYCWNESEETSFNMDSEVTPTISFRSYHLFPVYAETPKAPTRMSITAWEETGETY